MTHSVAPPASPKVRIDSESLAQRVRRELDGSGYSPLRQVRVSASATGLVHLEGLVPSFYLKQVAQSHALGVDGVVSVENRLLVSGSR